MFRKYTAAVLAAISVLMLALPAFAARTDIAATNPVSINGSIAALAADVGWTAADVANKNSTTSTGREMLVINNTGGGSAYTVTVTSLADDLGRTGDITTYSVGNGLYSILGPFPTRGWKQADGKLYFEASNAAVKFIVVRIPGTI